MFVADFDANTPTFTYGYTYQQAGSSSQTNGVAPGVGVGGTSALQVNADFTAAEGFFSGIGGGIGQIPPRNPVTRPASKADFRYTGAFRVSGLDAAFANTPVQIELQFYAPDGPDADMDRDRIVNLGGIERPVLNNGSFTTLTGDFGSATENNGTFAALQSFVAGGGMVDQVQVNINFPAGNDFDRDTDNFIFIDNFTVSQVSQVPEPAAGGLLVAGAGGLLARRRRRRHPTAGN